MPQPRCKERIYLANLPRHRPEYCQPCKCRTKFLASHSGWANVRTCSLKSIKVTLSCKEIKKDAIGMSCGPSKDRIRTRIRNIGGWLHKEMNQSAFILLTAIF